MSGIGGDVLGLAALDDGYATLTIGQVLAARATDPEILGLLRRRLDGESCRRVEGMAPDELRILVDLERKAMCR